MRRFVIMSLCVAVLFIYGCSQTQKKSTIDARAASAVAPPSPTLETIALEIDGMA